MPLSSRRLCAAALALVAASARAQERRRLPADHPQAQLMGYYAAVMAFTPTGLVDPSTRWEIGAEATYIPSLTREKRLVGFGGTKDENTNFCPVFPRLRASRAVGAWALEVGYVPRVRACGILPHMVSGALMRRIELSERWGLAVRAGAHYGTLNAPITCSDDAIAQQANQTCFGGKKSDDRVEPLSLALDGAVTFAGWRAKRVEPYGMVGLRREDVRFNVHFEDAAGLVDNQRLGTTLTRVHAAVGAGWRATPRLRLGGELYYAPAALLTVRGRASYAFGEGSRR